MKQIKKLQQDDLKQIYKAHIREDFPRNERRPYSSMEKMTNEGKYASYGYYDDNRLLAYACYILTEDGMYALLDYFAVIPELRGHGTGSEFLQKLEGTLPAKNGAFIEAESPDTAKSDEEVAFRQKRIHFYLSNGAVLTNTKCLLFGVDYNILYIGRSGINLSVGQLHCAVQDLYREIYRPFYGRLCKPYVSNENQCP
ncbi:MAG: GNAT family N-acetyltransferase [Lachnospiraceae bacterium]|nr:GNAT family N-acetyltransferase [Lachnospiraceae bacterium]